MVLSMINIFITPTIQSTGIKNNPEKQLTIIDIFVFPETPFHLFGKSCSEDREENWAVTRSSLSHFSPFGLFSKSKVKVKLRGGAWREVKNTARIFLLTIPDPLNSRIKLEHVYRLAGALILSQAEPPAPVEGCRT